MATLAEIKQQLNISTLPLSEELDQNGNKTGWLCYKNEEKKIIVRIPKNLAEQLKQNPQMGNLKLNTSFDGVYDTHIVINVDVATHSANQKDAQPDTTVGKNAKKTNFFNNIFSKINHSEIIVVSVVIGAIVAVVLGYCFEVPIDPINFRHYPTKFNSLLALFGFIIFGGITYLFLKIKNRKS